MINLEDLNLRDPEDFETFVKMLKESRGLRAAVKSYMAEDESDEKEAEGRAYSDPKLGKSWKTSDRIKLDTDKEMRAVDQALLRRFSPQANSQDSVISEMLSIYRKEKSGFRANDRDALA